MQIEMRKWFSKNLKREMDVAVYGYYGYALLLFPAEGSDFLECERFQLIDSIANFINSGTLKVFSVNSISQEYWLNKEIDPADKAIYQNQFNKYVTEEVVDFITQHCNGSVPIIIAGASSGAFQAANIFFRQPDLFAGVIAMSGNYDLKLYTGDSFDDNCYFNSPVDYLPNLSDENILEKLRNKNIIIASGLGANENPDSAKRLSQILHAKEISHWLDLWGYDMNHDWPTWRKMLPYFLDNINV